MCVCVGRGIQENTAQAPHTSQALAGTASPLSTLLVFEGRGACQEASGVVHFGKFTPEFWSPAFLVQSLDFLSTPRDDRILGGRLLLTRFRGDQ